MMRSNKLHKTLWISIVFVLILSVSGVFAQEPPPDEGRKHERQSKHERQGKRGRHRQGPPEYNEKTREMMMSMKIWKLTEALNVDEKLAEKLYPRVRELEAFRFESQKELESLVKKLDRHMALEKTDMSEVEKLVDQIRSFRLNQSRIEQEKEDSIMSLLTVEQRAKYILVEANFHQNIRRFLREFRGPGQGDRRREQ